MQLIEIKLSSGDGRKGGGLSATGESVEKPSCRFKLDEGGGLGGYHIRRPREHLVLSPHSPSAGGTLHR